jgi:predicted  nucleic acid-binding Zn-ribbon protein
MTDDIIKKIFEVTSTQGKVALEQRKTAFQERLTESQQREKYYTELISQVNNALNDISKRSKEADPEQIAIFFATEIKTLTTRLSKIGQTVRDDVFKLQGALSAYDESLKLFDHLATYHDSELQKARDIQEKSKTGSLEKKRSPGERPDKLKDVRNYTLKSNKESSN